MPAGGRALPACASHTVCICPVGLGTPYSALNFSTVEYLTGKVTVYYDYILEAIQSELTRSVAI